MDKIICLVKDAEDKVVKCNADLEATATALALVHNSVIEDGVKANKEFADSISGWHCSFWSEDGNCLGVYGEEGSLLCEERMISDGEVYMDIVNIFNFNITEFEEDEE